MAESKPTSIEKALDIMLAFTPYNQELGTGEISQKLGLHKATASRILRSLADKGFLQQHPESKKFTLGPAAAAIGRAYINGLDSNLVQLARPFIDDLRGDLEETVVLEILSGTSTVMAYIAEGPQRVRIAGTVGDRLPPHAAAGAKAILAFLPEKAVQGIVGDELARLTSVGVQHGVQSLRRLGRIDLDHHSLVEAIFSCGIAQDCTGLAVRLGVHH